MNVKPTFDEPDPLLILVDGYKAGLAAYDTHPVHKIAQATDEQLDAAMDETYEPPLAQIEEACPPATTMAGALAALRLAKDEAHEDRMTSTQNLIAAALAFLNRGQPS